MKIITAVLLSLCIEYALSHGTHHRVARQGGPPPPGGMGGMGGPPGGSGTTTPNYNYAASTKSADQDPVITSWRKSDKTKSSKYNCYLDINKIQYSSTYVYVSASSIPSYTIGPWPMNPNNASDQGWTLQFPRVPVENTGNKTSVSTGAIGIWSNGVAMFNADDAQTISGWSRNAYFFESSSFDSCWGHPQQQGNYHHHVIPICLYTSFNDSSKHSPIIGYAYDGYPVYGSFGYSVFNDSTSSIKRIMSGYRLRTMGSRTTLASGASMTGPAINATYPLGAFLDDFEWASGVGDLDANNGRFCVTPEYPMGTYAYFITTDSTGTPAYPYTLGKQYFGYVVSANAASGKVTPSESVTTYFTAGSGLVKSNIFASLLAFVVAFAFLMEYN